MTRHRHGVQIVVTRRHSSDATRFAGRDTGRGIFQLSDGELWPTGWTMGLRPSPFGGWETRGLGRGEAGGWSLGGSEGTPALHPRPPTPGPWGERNQEVQLGAAAGHAAQTEFAYTGELLVHLAGR